MNINIIHSQTLGFDKMKEKTAVAMGNFDGLHIGHMMLIDALNNYKRKNPKTLSCIWTYSEHTVNILKSGFILEYITTVDEKAEILKNRGIDLLIFQDFNYVRHLTYREFIKKILIDTLNAEFIVCGYDFGFGKNREGNAEKLQEELAKENIRVEIIPPVICDGQVVSSSFIRTLIKIGDMERVEKFLGRPFSINFPVIYGKQIGRKIGVPTINQLFPGGHIIPACGVYACTCEVMGKAYKALTNIGVRPTVNGDCLNAETHIINFDGDLYGKNIKVLFHKKIRDEIKFNSLDELKAQIQQDLLYVSR